VAGRAGEINMHKYILKGKLQPEERIVDLNIQAISSFKHVEWDIEGRLEMTVTGSYIKLVFLSQDDYSTGTPVNFETLHNVLIEWVRFCINAYGYTNSFYLDVYLLDIACEELNTSWNFGIKAEYNIDRSNEEQVEEFQKIFRLVSGTEYSSLSWIKDVFFDFYLATKYAAQTAQYCFRAIEIIRRSFYEDFSTANEKTRRFAGWKKLLNDLGYTEDDFKLIKQYGVPNRHGEYPAINYETREKIMNFTRGVIDRFIDKAIRL
jgi:hypothetical protein